MEEQRQGRWRKVRIYLDSYIVSGFWLHLLCLYLAGTILGSRNGRIKKGRLVIAALCGTGLDTLITVLLLQNGIDGMTGVTTGTALLGLILGAGIAFGRERIIGGGLLLFTVTALLAGFFQVVPVRNVGLFCLVGTVLLPFVSAGIGNLFRVKQTQRWLYEVTLIQNGEEKQIPAFMDTGNRLRLPGSSVPVVLVDKTYLMEWIKEAEHTMPQKRVFLPYKGVGGKGILQGIRLQCRLTTEDGRAVSGTVAAVAAEHNLFHGCEYRMILQPEVLTMECVADTQEGECNVI